jgi:hypothetical protein
VKEKNKAGRLKVETLAPLVEKNKEGSFKICFFLLLYTYTYTKTRIL